MVENEALTHADRLFHLARYLTGEDAEAEDLVQETYMRALAAARTFEPGTNLKAWLYRILRNTFIDGYRRRRQHPSDGLPNGDTSEDLDGGWRDDSELEQLRNLMGHEIQRALASLPEDQRTVILLDLEGLTEVEVSQVVGCAVGTVKSRLSRARAALRQKLAEYKR